MERIYSALLALLRAGLWESEVDELTCFPLTEAEWKKVYLLSRQQTVTGVVFQGIQHLPERFLPSEGWLVRWMAETDAIERKNRQMNRILEELVRMFASYGVNPVLQKGQGVASFYKKPLWRECGDIDFYFNDRHLFEKALSVVRQGNVRVNRQADESVVYVWKGIEVEHHTRLLDLHNPFLQREADRLERKYGYGRFCLEGNTPIQVAVPSPVLNLLLQSLHILKHALGWGIGLRQLCDMARSCEALHWEVDAEEMREISRRLGLSHWQRLLHACLVNYMGVPVEGLPYPDRASDAAPLLDIVWRGGNFGQYASGSVRPAVSPWRRKWQTACAFRRNVGFAFRYAPKESFWIFSSLLKGQIK